MDHRYLSVAEGKRPLAEVNGNNTLAGTSNSAFTKLPGEIIEQYVSLLALNPFLEISNFLALNYC